MEKVSIVQVAMWEIRLEEKTKELNGLDAEINKVIDAEPSPEILNKLNRFYELQAQIIEIKKWIREATI